MYCSMYKITNVDLIRDMIETCGGVADSKMTLATAYKRSHSIIRSQLFYLKLEEIPSFVSVHLVRHSNTGQYHYVSSARSDWTGVKDEETNRSSLVNHVMILNAQHLIDMAKVRLCSKAHIETQGVMNAIKDTVKDIDEDLYNYMQPKCAYMGYCNEESSCGKVDTKELKEWRGDRMGFDTKDVIEMEVV